MRKLTPIADNASSFMESVINSLRKDDTFKNRCKKILEDNKDYVEEYDTDFFKDALENLVGNHPQLTEQDESDIKFLYKYDRKMIKSLRARVLTTDTGYKISYCPICGVNLVQTMDHFIPQSDYPLFSVHPRNLIPSCQTCNGHKSDTIIDENNHRKYWNAYLDEVPTEKFLYCNIFEVDGIINVDFYILQGNIETDLFDKIKHTLEGQFVLDTYKDASGGEIEEFSNDIIGHIKDCSPKTFDICINELRAFFTSYSSSNDWKKVLHYALINSDAFVIYVRNKISAS